MKKAFVLVACLLLSVFFVNAQNNVIDAELQKILNQRNDDYIDVNIMFKSQMQTDNLSSFYCKSDSKEVRREIVVNELKKFAEQSQKDVLSVVKAEERSKDVIDVKTYWIANFINCKAKADVIYKLASHPDVALITYNSDMDVVSNTVSEADSRAIAATSDIYPHLTQIKADKVWDLGYTGKGIVVAVLDSGTNFDHADIKDHLWNGNGKYGYNVHSPNSLPSDEGSNGHGSHCAGIVCGDGTSGKMTGVAPDATLMTIKIIGGGRCTAANLVEGVQKASELGADVISLSVGRENPDENRALFRQTFTNLLNNFGIAAAVACGNDGNSSTNPAPDNVRTPGDCPPPWISPDQQGNAGGLTSVISVGAVNENNVVSPSSSKGPVTWQSISGYNDYPYNPGIGLIRPDIAAPGENVYSIRHDANDTYWGKSGTSQAAPCVAGVMALMLEKNPDLTPADLCRIIETTAVKLTATKSNSTGAGLIDALAAVQAVNFNDPVVINPYAFTSTLNTGSNLNLQLTLINNGNASTNGNTSVTISENDAYVAIVEGSKTYSTMASGATASATFVVNVDPLVEDNHTVTFTVTATKGNYSHTFNLDVNIDNEFVAPSLTAQANGRDINLTWNATNNATSYNIYRNGAFLANTTSTSYTDAGLEYGTLYAYTVTSKRGELESEHSLVARAQTEDNPDKPSPTNVKVNNGVVTWTNGADSKGSNIYRKDVNTSVETNIATNVNGASYTDNNWNSLADGVYQYGVANTYAVNGKIYEEGFENITVTDTASTYEVMNMYWYYYNEGGKNYKWESKTSHTQSGQTYVPHLGTNAVFIQSLLNDESRLTYLVSRQMDYTQHNGGSVKLSFHYITPAWGNDINTLKVMISTTSYNSGWTELWSSNKTDVSAWTKAEVDLSNYVGQQFYIAFVNVAGYGYCTGVDEVSVAVEGNSESRIEWSDNVYKGVNVFVNDGLWSNTDNWSAKRLPTENDAEVIINANATIASGDITVNSLTINEGGSLTLNSGTTLIVNDDFTNTDADAFIINDGAQVFQNNADVAATFVMNIVNPTDWNNNHKEGWQFIASPVKGAKIVDFVPIVSDYDLYKYDGTRELEWLNHKDENTYEPEPELPAAPQNLVATATGPYSIALTWNAVDGATRYKIYRNSNLIASYVYNPSYSSEGLTQATTYCYTVVAVNENGESAESNEACATTDLAIPTAPQNVVAEAASSSSIRLTWNAVAGAATYNIYLGDALVASGITSTEHTINGLDSEFEYCYAVTAVNALGESPKSEKACATTPMAMPDVPQNLVATAAGSSVELTWSVAAGAASYNVYDDNGLVVSGITSANHTVYDLEAGEHCFTVSAVNAAGESARSAQACATTTAQDPDTPIAEHLIIGDGNSTTGVLPLNSLYAYSISQQIYTRGEIGQTGDIKSVSFKYKSGLSSPCTRTVKVYLKHTTKVVFASATDWESMTDADLVYDGDITINGVADEWVRIKLDEPFEYTGNNLVVCVYDYTGTANDQITFAADEIGNDVKAMYFYNWMNPAPLDPSNMNNNGNIPNPVKRNQIRFSFVTGNEPAIPAAPSNLMATCSQELNIIEAGENDIYEYANAITLTWNADNTAESYNIYDEGGNKIGQTGGNTFTIDGLETATRYCFSVSAVNETGEGATAEVCTTTITEVPQNLVARSTDETTINLSWDAVEGATSYRAYLGGQLVATDITATSCDITGLVTGNYYCYSVAAVNEGGESFKSVLACAEAGDIQLEMCKLIFTLYDLPWGDGWRQGSKITVSYGESSVDFKTPTYDAETSAYKETYHTLSIPKGTEVTVTYTRGANEFAGYYENSFDVKCENGTVLLVTNAEELLGGETFTFIADCTLPLPNAPVLEANATSSTEIALTWNEVATATSYNVYQGGNKITTVTTPSYNVEGLTANTEYCFTVTAVNAIGESEASNEACEKTLLATPTNLVATANGENSIVLTWDAVDGATSYKIYSGETAIATVTETTYTKELLIAGTEYCYSVSAVNEDGESAKTTPACATTDEAAPEELCTVVFTLGDTYGDGWSNDRVAISYNGYTEYLTFTVNLSGPKEYSKEYVLEIKKGTHVTVTYQAGASYSFPSEESLVIKYENNIEVIYSINTMSNGCNYEFDVNCSSDSSEDPITPEIPENPEGALTTFLYSFDDGNLDAFTLIDEDGDGNNWELLQNAVASYSWKSGIGAFIPKNYIYTNEIYTITTTSKLMYRVTGGGYPDKYAVVISEDGNTFEIVFEETTSTSTFTQKEIDLSAYAGRVVHFGLLHYDCTDKYYVRIDDFQLTDGSAKSSSAPAKMTDLKAGFEKANSVTYSGTELSKFEETFQQGIGYLVSYETETTATFKGTLNHENSYSFDVTYNNGKDLANFHLLGNPFAFNMKWNNVNANNMVNGYAVVNEDGGYEYLTTGEIKVGDGFLVKSTGPNPSLTYNTRSRNDNNNNNFLNITSSSIYGKDNVIISFSGEQDGFPKVKNFNEDIALLYVYDNNNAYGIYNCDSDVKEVELVFRVSKLGEYNIHIEPNGEFDYITLVDRISGIETNMLTSSYSFMPKLEENGNRFVLKLSKDKNQIDEQYNLVYQSGNELILNANGTVQIIDIMGRVIYSSDVTSDNNRIDISGLTKAAYIVRLITETDVKTQKVVVY